LLVNSIWRALAQAELRRHLFLKNKGHSNKVRHVTGSHLAPELSRTVQSVRFGEEERWDDVDGVFDGWEAYARLNEVWITSDDPVAVDFTMLSQTIPSASFIRSWAPIKAMLIPLGLPRSHGTVC
jgi:hypothetical protein